MLQAVIVEQAGWLLPLAVLGLFVAGRQAWPGAAGHVAGDRGAQDEASCVGTTALQWRTLALYPAWSTWLTPVVLVLGLAAAAALVARRPAGGRLAAVA